MQTNVDPSVPRVLPATVPLRAASSSFVSVLVLLVVVVLVAMIVWPH
jgi:hypothetical protein